METVRRNLIRTIQGKTVTSVTVHTPQSILKGDPNQLVGMTFADVQRVGKYLILLTDGNLTLTAHLGMSGMFIWSGDIQEVPSHVRVVIGFHDGLLYFRDIRRLKGLWIHGKDSVVWKEIGIDALSPDFTTTYLASVLASRKRDIKQLLLDQSLIAGIGNIYASEILFRAGISPQRSGQSLKNKEISALHSAVVDILEVAISMGGTTLRDYRLSNGSAGEFRQILTVYGREGENCTKCGSVIQRITQGQRSSYFCPSKGCQR